MFEKMVLPVLLYGSEIWGYENSNILEKLQLQFLKYLFHLPRNTMTDLIYGDTGFVPISILIKSRLIRFWTGLVLPQHSNKFSSKIYKLIYDLHVNCHFEFPWLENIKNILIECGYDCVWDSQSFASRNSLCANISRALKDKFVDTWSEALHSSNKCLFYRHYKTEFRREKYIMTLPNIHVINLMKFRCSCHKLPIEIGRRLGLDRQDRLCDKCDMQAMGDEYHFLIECPYFEHLRNALPRFYVNKKSVFYFCQLMSKPKFQLKIAKFIKSGNIV